MVHFIIAIFATIGFWLQPIALTTNSKKISIKEYSKYTKPLETIYGQRYCSSVAINYRGEQLTLTNNHCCEAISPTDKLAFVGGNLEFILYKSPYHDVCILTSSLKSPIKVATKEVELLDFVLVIGYPLGGYLTPVTGWVTAKDVTVSINYDYAIPDLPSNFVSNITYPGNSGSPVFNSKGEVVNLIFAGNPTLITIGITVPNKFIIHALEDYRAKKKK